MSITSFLKTSLTNFQSFLSFEPSSSPAFLTPSSPARSGFLGLLLGSLLTFHLLLPLLLPSLLKWCLYTVSLLTFHVLEYVITALYNGRVLTSTSFLVDHSEAYTVAAVASWTEYWFRTFLFGPTPLTNLNYLGISLVLLGQSLRSLSLITCGSNFNHIIQVEGSNVNKRQRLVREGIYRVFRHPSYTGWFYWSVGTQCILGNPICIVAYTYVSWKFFKERIPFEEKTLEGRFKEYKEYKEKSWVGIPFIR
ncbi:hypothetical protein TrST_g3833 [Triparma strigata]|uniref:Protein-S-isoprenylcysteine O-methyltransferase n=1 Tax=Triparma strigata TaxID=1606541 RepID=A0A9W7BR23_9STRA|nr:hypothetical protein TrST_g3833 [Triparma strigata]